MCGLEIFKYQDLCRLKYYVAVEYNLVPLEPEQF